MYRPFFIKHCLFLVIMALGQGILLAQGSLIISGYIKSVGIEQAPITAAMIRLVRQTPEPEILAYTQSNEDGYFQIRFSAQQSEGLFLIVSAWGYEKQLIPIDSLPSLTNLTNLTNLTILCPPKSFKLEEVLIEETAPVSQSIDTISFQVSAYVDSTERNLEDIVKKLPGTEVDNDGKISFGGKYINRILVEGDDISGSDYTIVSQNVSANSVRKIEFIYDYVENELLAGFDMPESLIMNVELDSTGQRRPSGNVHLGIGNAESYSAGTHLTFFSSVLKSINLLDYQSLGKELYIPSQDNIEALHIASPHHPTLNGRTQIRPFAHEAINIPIDLAPFRNNRTGWGQARFHYKPVDSYRMYLEIGGGLEQASEQLTRQLLNQVGFSIDEQHEKSIQQQAFSGTLKNFVTLSPKANLTTASSWHLNGENTFSNLALTTNVFDIQTVDSSFFQEHKLVYLNKLNPSNLLAITGTYKHKKGNQLLGIRTEAPYYFDSSFLFLTPLHITQPFNSEIRQFETNLRLIRKSRIGSSNLGLRYGSQQERLYQTDLHKSHFSTQIKHRYSLSKSWRLLMDLQPGIYFLSLDRGTGIKPTQRRPHFHGAVSLQKKRLFSGWTHLIGFDQILPEVQHVNQSIYLDSYRSTQLGDPNLRMGYKAFTSHLFSYARNLNPLKAFTLNAEIQLAIGQTPYQQMLNIDNLLTGNRWEAIPQNYQQLSISGALHKYVHPIRTGFKLKPRYQYNSYVNQWGDQRREIKLHTLSVVSFIKVVTDYHVNLALTSNAIHNTFHINGNANGTRTWTQKHKVEVRFAPKKEFWMTWRSEYLQLGQEEQAINQYLFHELEAYYALFYRKNHRIDFTFTLFNLSNQRVYGVRTVDDIWIRSQEVRLRPRTFFLMVNFDF